MSVCVCAVGVHTHDHAAVGLGKVNSMNGCMDQSAGHFDLLTLQVCCAVGIGEGSRTAVTDTDQ